MQSRVHILASCTNGKRYPIPREFRLGTVRGKPLADRAATWWARLTNPRGTLTPASDLYRGPHWDVVCNLPAVALAAGLEPRSWVLSAGYGLIPTTAQIHPYSATFSPGNPDSVSRKTGTATSVEAVLQEWWLCLSGFPGPDEDAPRSIADLARRDPTAAILIVASPRYVRAIEPDVRQAVQLLRKANRLLIISGPLGGGASPLCNHLIRSDAALRTQLGGALFSLHARVARWVLKEATPTTLTVEAVRARLDTLRTHIVEVVRPARQRMTDAEVQQFVQNMLPQASRPKASSFLRVLRDSGRACEQSRFKAIFTKVMESHAS